MKLSKYLTYGLCLLVCVGCGRPTTAPGGGFGMPIKLADTNYPIDVFYENQATDRPYVSLGEVKVEKEVPLNGQQTRDRRMLYRGNNEEQKKALLDQLIVAAVAKGAHALVNVKYQYYTGKDYQGFVMQGMAVKYGQ